MKKSKQINNLNIMSRYNVLLLWGIISSLLDKSAFDTHSVVASLIIIFITTNANNKRDIHTKKDINLESPSIENIIGFIVGFAMLISGILMCVVKNKYPLTANALISIGVGLISYILFIKAKNKAGLRII